MTETVTPFKLDPKELNLPAWLPVLDITVEDHTDWQGNPAWKVILLLDDSVTLEDRIKASWPVREALHAALPGDRFPYSHMYTPSDLAEMAAARDEEDE